ncbi:glycosyltransferase family 2 protein [Butyrivibrio sp.]|uniref:glycosyltransferase family 2 protein n=1 Tax=Butyrivibrio sp. TaxID=28121 RepID=UPI0025B8140A|nr:glycosyltransferase family 2 protein [Butyrivibrio sp.]MBQ9301566.1 glycosyltransferase family 2 protein [Butyrivibrio sp.]
MRLTVVVPVFNEEKNIDECITSILNQSKKDIDVIIIDDGSTDMTGAICDNYMAKDARIRVFHQANEGMIHARKRGVEESRTEYVTFIDADDFIDKDSFELADIYMEKGIDLICFGYKSYKDGVISERDIYVKEGYYTRKEIISTIYPNMIWDEKYCREGVNVSLWNKVMKRELLLQCYETLNECYFDFCEDRAVVYQLMKIIKDMQVSNYGYYYHRNRADSNFPKYMTDERFFEKLFEYYKIMKTVFSGEPKFLKQLDLSYISLVSLRSKIYGKTLSLAKYLFPFDKIQQNEMVAIYGAGEVGRCYVEQIERLSYCKLKYWVDVRAENLNDRRIEPIQVLNANDYDHVIIANSSQKTINNIKNDLIGIGVRADKIVF